MPGANADTKPARKGLRPKLAASLILTRRRAGGGVELLLGRRSGGHVFMPRKYVFPGGRVDRADSWAPLAREPSGTVRSILTRVLPETRARAAAAAALRETAEETGLLLASPGVIERPKAPWLAFAEAGVRPDAAPLDVIARAITPPGRTRRFDAWFFQADVEHLHGRNEPAGNGELEDLRWVTIEDTHSLDLPVITRFVLSELEARMKGETRPVRCARVTRSGPRVDEI